jgi:hypothetical protein
MGSSMIYMTLPVVLHPRAVDIGRDERFDFYLTNSERAYGRPPSGIQNLFRKVSDGALEIETYGAATLRMVLAGRESNPRIIFDCRGNAPAIGGPAPSYKLAAKAGLRTASPVMLAGQGGIEAIQAMQFFAGSVNVGTCAIVTSSWNVSKDIGAPSLTDLLTSACLLSRIPFDDMQLRIHGIGQARRARDVGAAIEIAIAEAMRNGGTSEPKWIEVAPTLAAIKPWLHRLPTAATSDVDTCRHRHVGFPDPLVALARYSPAIHSAEPGLLVCIGTTGSVGALIVSISDREATQ